MLDTIKIWWSRVIRSKTMHAANIIMLLGIIQANSDYLSEFLTPKQFGGVMMAIAILMGYLRVITHKSLEDK